MTLVVPKNMSRTKLLKSSVTKTLKSFIESFIELYTYIFEFIDYCIDEMIWIATCLGLQSATLLHIGDCYISKCTLSKCLG